MLRSLKFTLPEPIERCRSRIVSACVDGEIAGT